MWTLCNPLVLKFGYSFFPLSLPPSLNPSLSFFCWRMFRNHDSMECGHFCSSDPLPESGQTQNIYNHFYTAHVFLAEHKFMLVSPTISILHTSHQVSYRELLLWDLPNVSFMHLALHWILSCHQNSTTSISFGPEVSPTPATSECLLACLF